MPDGTLRERLKYGLSEDGAHFANASHLPFGFSSRLHWLLRLQRCFTVALLGTLIVGCPELNPV